MEAALIAAAEWFDAIGYSDWARFTPRAYPVANVVHLFGLIMLVGAIGVVDLRTVGVWRKVPLEALSRALTPVAVAGLVILVASGSVLFAADGQALASSGTFHLKLILILIALANVVLFRLVQRSRGSEDAAPPLARVAAAASLLLWLAVTAAGRMIAYT